ncbi:MAG TPA: hypothetical protein PLL69_08740, partial [Gemmatimonadales bacterium]|nr:hypothetical protein [Gemmatimonadales bacterium]
AASSGIKVKRDIGTSGVNEVDRGEFPARAHHSPRRVGAEYPGNAARGREDASRYLAVMNRPRLSRFALLLMAGVAAQVTVVPAQSVEAFRMGFRRPVAEASLQPAPMADSLPVHGSMWFEGGIVAGSVVAALAGSLVVWYAHDNGRNVDLVRFVPVVAISGMAGFAPGALIGSIFPKRAPSGQGSTGRSQWRRGAIIGGISGALVPNLIVNRVSGRERLEMTLIGGASGFLWGMLIGSLEPEPRAQT